MAGHRVSDFPDEAEAWPDIEDEMIPDPMEPVASGPYGPPFTYLHAARVTLDSGLVRPTKLLARTAARLTLKVAREQGDLEEGQGDELAAIAEWRVQVDEPEDLLDILAEISAFVEQRITLPEDR